MTDPVKRPAPIRERFLEQGESPRVLVLTMQGVWFVEGKSPRAKVFDTFEEAIRFATQDQEIGACS